MSTEKAMSQCLKAFYLIGNPKDYALYEMNEKGGFFPCFLVSHKCWTKTRRLTIFILVNPLDGSELKLDMEQDFRNQLRFDPKRPTLIFRRDCSDDPYLSTIRVFCGDLM